MRIRHLPEDFRVEEDVALPEGQGAYVYYRIRKSGISTMAVRDEMAELLKVTPSALIFPAIKDAASLTIQYASVRKQGPEEIAGKGFVASRVGCGARALRPKDLNGNRYALILRDLSEQEAQLLREKLLLLEVEGVPNYFDEQRFGSLAAPGFIGKAILVRDVEQAVRFYLSEPMLSDPRRVREFKMLVKSHWGQWGYLLHQAPRPSNYRSVITYLKDHPHDYQKAVNLIQDRLLSLYLSAYQAWIWNLILGRYFESVAPPATYVDIVGTRFPVPEHSDDVVAWQKLQIDLPRLTACYEGELAEVAEAVFISEGLSLRDFKARILRRVYLPKGERTAWFVPSAVAIADPYPDDQIPNRWALSVNFTLPSGYYATLVLKVAAANAGVNFPTRGIA
ncbi:MAG: tRNA pseudouridine(13) synthase TruD [Anaerolineae bacterium]|nr:tRNA pseudouridine(13) synthase TruD [Anaerolineae bacterium]